MENNFTQSTLSKLRALAIYYIAGGIIGVTLTVWLILKLTMITVPLLLLLSVIIGLYAHSIYCGALLLEKKTSGFRHSLINQWAQFINFSIAGFTFKYVSGFFVSMGFELMNPFNFIFNFGISSWKITIGGDAQPLEVNFNFVALLLIVFIYGLKRKIRQEQTENQIASIGQG
jgi:hypothetical protein